MKHAGNEALDQLDELLEEIRRCGELKEKKRGVFYLKSTAFLHFHEDATGIFADLHAGPEWEQLAVNSRSQQQKLLRRIRPVLKH